MSNDTMPCGCEGHADNEGLCRYPALEQEANNYHRALDAALEEVNRLRQRADLAERETERLRVAYAETDRRAAKYMQQVADISRERDEAREQFRSIRARSLDWRSMNEAYDQHETVDGGFFAVGRYIVDGAGPVPVSETALGLCRECDQPIQKQDGRWRHQCSPLLDDTHQAVVK